MTALLFLGSLLVVGQPPSPTPSLASFPALSSSAFETLTGMNNPPQPLQPIDLTIDVPVRSPPPAPAAQVNGSEASSQPEGQLFMRLLQGTWYGAVLNDSRMTVTGWVDASFTASTDRHNQLPMGFNYLANNFQLEQNWVRVQRSVDESSSEPTWGFLVDSILPGSDYRFTLARGLLTQQLTADHGSPSLYGIDIVQFYTELYLPDIGRGLDLKFGRFFAQFGVESIDSVLNPFVSRSYTFIYNPFTNTGLLSTLKLTNEWSVQNGLVTGSDVFIDPAANPTYIGGVKWEPDDDHASADFEVILGSGRYNRALNLSNPEIFDLVLMRKLTNQLTWTGEGLYGFQTNAPDIGFANWFGIVNYLSYEFDHKLIANARLEFFDDVQGQRTGYKGLYEAITAGVTYKPLPCLWLRPEIRFDHNDSGPFEGHRCLLTAAFDWIVLW